MAKLGWNKWNKYRILKESSELRSHLPETFWMQNDAMWRLLNKYGDIIVKPSGSYGGHGVIQITAGENEQFKAHEGPRIKIIEGNANLEAYIKKKTSKNYIVQQRISLASIIQRPFDLRVMVQRRDNSNWKITGKLAKVAGKGYIVTNIKRSKGRVLTVDKAIQLSSSLNKLSAVELLQRINHTAILTAKQIRRYYPYVRTMGIDLGFDKQGKLWIIEVNFAPSKTLFNKLQDKSSYRRILSY